MLPKITKEGEIKCFQTLQKEFNLGNQDFYMYSQAQDYYQKEIRSGIPEDIKQNHRTEKHIRIKRASLDQSYIRDCCLTGKLQPYTLRKNGKKI